MYNNILIQYLFLVNFIISENSFSGNFGGISENILIEEFIKCEDQIKFLINHYESFNLNLNYNEKFDTYIVNSYKENKNNKNFDFDNNNFYLKDISSLNKNYYTINQLTEKKNNYKFQNVFIIKNFNKNYYVTFFKNNYFNITNIINFIFNINLLDILEDRNSIKISSDLNLINLKSYKNINKNITNNFNVFKNNDNKNFFKFYKNLDYLESLNLKNENINLAKNHLNIINNLYTGEYNFKILLNFLKKDSYKEFYLKLPINYTTSKIYNGISKCFYSPTIDHYLNNLLYDKIFYNQYGNDLKESFIFVKKKISNSPLIFNYKFKNKFTYFANKKYNLNINEIKEYNLDYFNISKTKKIKKTHLSLDYFYYGNGHIKSEISKASVLIQYYLPRVRPFVMRASRLRQRILDNQSTRILIENSDQINVSLRIKYNHYLYGFSKGGTSSLVNFTQIDMFHNNFDIFFFKGNTFNKQHHHVSILNKIVPLFKNKKHKPFDFLFDYNEPKRKLNFFRSNFIYQKTKYERALNLMFNFNEELKPNNTLKDYIFNLLFGFVKDNNDTYITFKDHYNKNNFICKNILYRINNYDFHNNVKKYNLLYRESLDVISKKVWEKSFRFNTKIMDKQTQSSLYLHTKSNYIYPNLKFCPISQDFLIKYYEKRGYIRNYRQVLHFYRFLSNKEFIPYSRFLKTGQLSQSVFNKYFNFIPFLYYVNHFDFIKKSNNYTKRSDFISFIPKFKIFSFKFFNSLENFKYYENSNSILIKFNNNILNNNTQKLDQSLYNLNNLNTKIINYIPDIYYDKYGSLEWNNNQFFNILNRKLLYKHLISFGDLSNIYIQEFIYNYIKVVFFDEKIRNIFFKRDIFKYKNFENLNDFIAFKINKTNSISKTLLISRENQKFNFLNDCNNIIKILINPYLHIKKHYYIYYSNLDKDRIIEVFNRYRYHKIYEQKDRMVDKEPIHDVFRSFFDKGDTSNFFVYFEDNFPEINKEINDWILLKKRSRIYDLKRIFFFHHLIDQMAFSKRETYEEIRRDYNFPIIGWIYGYNKDSASNYLYESRAEFGLDPKTGKYLGNVNTLLKEMLKNKLQLYNKVLAIDKDINEPIPDFYGKDCMRNDRDYFMQQDIFPEYVQNIFSLIKFHFYLHYQDYVHRDINRQILTKNERDFRRRNNMTHLTNYNFILYQIPSNFIYNLMTNKIYNINILDKISTIFLFVNLKFLSKFQEYDNFFNIDHNYKLTNFFKSKVEINNINLLKKKSMTHYKLYKNRLVEEAGLYNTNILNKDKTDEDFFLLYNRKRLDNESIYKSWHSSKFLNKKINYYSDKFSILDIEDKFKFNYNFYIWNFLRFKKESFYKLNYLTTAFYNYFSTDIDFDRFVFHTISSSSYNRNIRFNYPQNDITNVKIGSFISYIKEKIGYFQKNRYLNGSFRRYYYKKQIDRRNGYEEYGRRNTKTGIFLYGHRRTYFFNRAYKVHERRYPDFEESADFFKIDKYQSDLISLKTLTRKSKSHHMNRYLSHFQYYGDTRYPKGKTNFKKLNFIFNIYNFQSYFINDRYAFENKNIMLIKQFYNHRTTSDYLRNLIYYKKKDSLNNFYKDKNSHYNINEVKIINPYYNLYSLYSPVKIWEICLSKKLFPYFYSKNLSDNYKIVQYTRLEKKYDNLYGKRSNRIFRKKQKAYFFEYFSNFMFDLVRAKFLNFESEKNFYSFFVNNLFNNTKNQNQIKRKLYINTIGNIVNMEYNYNQYILKSKYLLNNEAYLNKFNFKINNESFYYSKLYKLNNKLPHHLNYKIFFDIYNFDKNIFLKESLKVFKFCVNNNFYVQLPYSSELISKNFYDFFNDKKIKFFKLRTAPYLPTVLYWFWFINEMPIERSILNFIIQNHVEKPILFFLLPIKTKPTLLNYLFKSPFCSVKPCSLGMKNALDTNSSFINYINNELVFVEKMFKNQFIFNFYNLNLRKNKVLIFIKYVYKSNYTNVGIFKSIYQGNVNCFNYNSKFYIKKKNNILFFSKVFEFSLFTKKNNNLYSYSFFYPYDFYIFRYKSSFNSLNKIYFKTDANKNLRYFMYNLFNFKEYKNKNFDFFYNLIDKEMWSLFDKDPFVFSKIVPEFYKNINYFTNHFKRNSFTLKYYENVSSYNKKKLEEFSFFGFLVKNNVIFGILEYNNLYNIAYSLKFENFHIHNNESNIYSIKKLLNTIFRLKNKYIWLIFFYYNNFLYFLINAKKILIDFILEPYNFWSRYFYFKIPILFSVEYSRLILDILLTIYTIMIQILIIFYGWFCISGEGLLNLKDYIIFEHNNIDWIMIYEKYNIYPCDLYGRSLSEMNISKIIFAIFFLGYIFLYLKFLFIISNFLIKTYNLLLLNVKRKKKYIMLVNNKFDLEINNKIHNYYLNYNSFIKDFDFIKNDLKIIFIFKDKHSYKYYKSKFKCRLKLPYFIDEFSLKRINKLKILTNFETHQYILDIDIKKYRTTLSFLNSSYALFTKTRTIEIGNLLIKGNIKRILYIHQLSNYIAYDFILGNFLMPKSMNEFERRNIYFIDKIFLNNQLKIFNLMPMSEDQKFIYIPKFIFKNFFKYKFKYINIYYTYNFLFFYFFDSLLTIEGTLFKISNPNFFKPLLFMGYNMLPRSFFFII
jgi:hypothetical protein